MYGRLFLYTPRSGSKIFARSQSPVAPRWALETLHNGSHIIHYTAPLYRVPSSTRQHRADVGEILKYVVRNADRDTSPRSLLAWDDRGEISFIADERSVMDIEELVRRFGRGEGLVEAIQHAREEEAIFGSGGADTRLFSSPASEEVLHVTNNYVSTHPAHKSREEVEMEPATFGDLPGSDAQYITSQLLDTLWNGMSAPVPTEEEAEQIVERFAAWMNWLSTEPHASDMKKMLLDPTGQELQDWANEHFEKHHRISLGFYPEWPAHWVDESKEDDEDEIASEPTPEPIAEITPEPTEEEIAAQKKNEKDALFAETWRKWFEGKIGDWFEANVDNYRYRVGTDADVAYAHANATWQVAKMFCGYSDMWWRNSDLFYRAVDETSLASYPLIVPFPRTVEYGDSPDAQVWWVWLQKLNPAQLIHFLEWTTAISEDDKDWNMDIDRDPKPDLKSKVDALSHAFPFPFAAEGLVPHPTQGGRFVLQDWNDLYLYRRRLPHAKFEVVRRHFAALVKMAEHAPAPE